ncbi:MAG: DUF4258 domain-containing protein [Actinomycetota bacterium]|nr:DUF4258 domain-containing protein [Actinomycetota bacterium]
MSGPITDYVVTPHATLEMRRRNIDEAVVAHILADPEQRIPVRPGREVLQSRIDFAGRIYLVRVFVDVDRSPAEVVTVYRAGRIEKYWRKEP